MSKRVKAQPVNNREEHVIAMTESPTRIKLISKSATRDSNYHVFVIGGHGNVQSDMQAWEDICHAACPGRNVWYLSYDYTKPFPQGADDLINALQHTGEPFNDIVYLCYSMGGLIGRHMIARGWPVTVLAAIASPNLGLMSYIPAIDDGVKSIKQGAQELADLNSDSNEADMRSRYLFCSITYTVQAVTGTFDHDDDMVVDRISAQSAGISGGFQTADSHLLYTGGFAPAPGAPHQVGCKPAYFESVTSFLSQAKI